MTDEIKLPPAPGVMCCANCRFGRHVPNTTLGADPFVECRWGPPSVVIMPAGLNQITSQPQLAIRSRFPAMGYTEFCHRFEVQEDVDSLRKYP